MFDFSEQVLTWRSNKQGVSRSKILEMCLRAPSTFYDCAGHDRKEVYAQVRK